ncbi:LysE family translocator [Jidongwangia harbinensis]|uniref:LysE family translocator n=1 Tax=Jidongwangia harbinensis TaxID=2878561 RepID=UPI001CD923F3|nr:LysE family translocator [Jidongwangia harbinensis]MCA2214364.1 LysE family translocator [Jidongwangia harbinensis]
MINWSGFLLAAVLVSLIPGANQLLGLSNAVRYGVARALAGIAGRLAAFVVLIGLVVAGLGAVLAASSTALTVVKWIGVGYLVWLGVTTLRRAALAPPPVTGPATAPAPGWWPLAATEFAVAISNPKALLLFAALLPQFATVTGGGGGAQIAVLGAAYLGIELLVGLGYVAAGAGLGAVGVPARMQRRVDVGAGVCFVGMAGLLALDEAV